MTARCFLALRVKFVFTSVKKLSYIKLLIIQRMGTVSNSANVINTLNRVLFLKRNITEYHLKDDYEVNKRR